MKKKYYSTPSAKLILPEFGLMNDMIIRGSWTDSGDTNISDDETGGGWAKGTTFYEPYEMDDDPWD